MSTLTKFLSVFASEIERIETAANAMALEFTSASVTDMIEEWETALGITIIPTDPIGTRRGRVIAKIRAVGGQSVEYFYGLAEALGYSRTVFGADPHITIATSSDEYFQAGWSYAGDKTFEPGSAYTRFTWLVYGTNVESDTFLQELFNLCKPAHTEIVFTNI